MGFQKSVTLNKQPLINVDEGQLVASWTAQMMWFPGNNSVKTLLGSGPLHCHSVSLKLSFFPLFSWPIPSSPLLFTIKAISVGRLCLDPHSECC